MSAEPLSDPEVRALGYIWGKGWLLLNPGAKPQHRPGLCKGCQKFTGHPDWEGLCAGCLWFGPGDPHGLVRARLRERLRDYREAGP